MDITKTAIEKNRITTVILVVLLLTGVSTYLTMPRSEDPGFIVRTALVQTFYPGASPERMELLVTDKLEKVIQQMPELRVVRSESKVGVSIIYAEIKKNHKNMRPLWDKLRRKINDAIPQLPEGVQGPFINDEFGDVFGTIVTLTGDGFEYRQLKQVADEVRNELLLLPDVAKVEIYGAQEERVFIEYNNARLAEFGLSPIQLQQILQARNIILPGGDVRTEFEKIVMEPSGNFTNIEDIKRTVINLPSSDDVVHLEDIVSVQRAYIDPPDTMMRANGESSLALAITLREGGNIISLGQQVTELVDRARSIYPWGYDFDLLLFQAGLVDKKISNFVVNLYQAIGIVGLVMLVFLGLRTGLIVASLIPSTMIVTLFVMSLFDIGLNQMSLASLIIALGMLVDNAIVMCESVMIRMQGGKSAKDAAIDSAKELKIPLLTSSLTTSAAFLPIFLAESETGEYTGTLFVVVTITLLVSWLMALTLIPLLCVFLMKVKKTEQATESFDSAGYRLYRAIMLTFLRRPIISLVLIIAIFYVSLQGFGYIPSIFFPDNDRPTFTIELDLPIGTPIQRTSEVARGVESFMLENLMGVDDQPGLTNWGTFIGEGAPKFNLSYNPKATAPNYAIIVANATDVQTIKEKLIPPIEDFIMNHYPDVKPVIKPLPLGDEAWPPIAVRISGRDSNKIFEIVDTVKEKLRSTPGTRQISDDWGTRSKKVVFDIDETRAQLAGVSHQDVAISAQTYLTGLATTEYREGDKIIPVVLRSNVRERQDYSRIVNLSVYSQSTGESVPLSQVSKAELVWQPAVIKRRQRLRTATVESLLQPGVTAASINNSLIPWLREESKSWPFGYSWELGGEFETSKTAEDSIAAKLPYAGLIIILLLIGQFNSFRRCAIILLTIPLSIIGVVVGLLVTKSAFGFMTLLGVISLAGIVINNAIVLLDRIRIEIEENGLEPARAVVHTAQQRLRPILLTTMTTVGGMLPLWFGGGPLWESMAIAVVFGMIVATCLTLGVVPILYSLLFRINFKGFQY